MKVNEIVKQLKQLTKAEEGYDSYSAYLDDGFYQKGQTQMMDGIGNVTLVDERGGEDEGSEYWKVFFFPDHDIYIKIEGYYSSYEGVEWNMPSQVYPQQKTITVYEPKTKAKKKAKIPNGY